MAGSDRPLHIAAKLYQSGVAAATQIGSQRKSTFPCMQCIRSSPPAQKTSRASLKKNPASEKLVRVRESMPCSRCIDQMGGHRSDGLHELKAKRLTSFLEPCRRISNCHPPLVAWRPFRCYRNLSSIHSCCSPTSNRNRCCCSGNHKKIVARNHSCCCFGNRKTVARNRMSSGIRHSYRTNRDDDGGTIPHSFRSYHGCPKRALEKQYRST